MTRLLFYMNLSNSSCFGYGSNVTSPSFKETILKYFLQKYIISFLHFFSSLALALNCSGVRTSFSPAFFMDASSVVYTPFCFCIYAEASCGPSCFYLPKSKFSNLSTVGFSIPVPIYNVP